MPTLIIACKTLENEFKSALKNCECTHDIAWFDSGLHNIPKKLKAVLQEIIDTADNYNRILMVMGFCGNSVSGLNSRNHTLILPKVDDCITLLLGSHKNRLSIQESTHSYFMTDGWLKGERNIWVEYEYAIKKYGEEQGKKAFNMMMGNYETLTLIETNSYDVSDVEEEMINIANALDLKYCKVDGTVDYIEQLLSGPYDEDKFLIVPPNTTIKTTDLTRLY